MEWINQLHNTIVAVDTAPLIYFIEEHPVWLSKVQPFFRALDEGRFRAIMSAITLTEVLVHPFRHSQDKLAEQYRRIRSRGSRHHIGRAGRSDFVAVQAVIGIPQQLPFLGLNIERDSDGRQRRWRVPSSYIAAIAGGKGR